MNENIHISIVSPVYRAEKIIAELVKQLIENVSTITSDFEIILVNDASPDNSWKKIIEECQKDKRVKGINLSRNFGQHYAITAGLSLANGEWIVVMDCDLQDRPDEIPNLYKKALEGYNIVFARRTIRQDNLLKKLSSKIFHVLYSYLSGFHTDESIANFGIYNNIVIREFNIMKENARSFPSLVYFLGFRQCSIEVKHSDRFEGKTSYSLSKLLKLAGDVVLSNSNKPLKIALKVGFSISLISFLLALYNVISYFLGFIQVPGFTTTIFSIWFIGGLTMFVLGIVGLYVGKTFDQVKERQLFVIEDKLNF